MPVCEKCGVSFPNRIKIDGVLHVVSNRKYCLKCSPFKAHNTRNLCSDIDDIQKRKIASERVRSRRRTLKEMSVRYKGGVCCICGYDRCISALEFHHVKPDEKSFGLSARGFTRSWPAIKDELDKCILVCSNCHREIESGLTHVEDCLI